MKNMEKTRRIKSLINFQRFKSREITYWQINKINLNLIKLILIIYYGHILKNIYLRMRNKCVEFT